MNDETEGVPLDIEPGRRCLTLLFADLSQSTELFEIMEAEHYAAMLAALRRIYHDTIERHGGTVVRVQGDGDGAFARHRASKGCRERSPRPTAPPLQAATSFGGKGARRR